MNQEKFYNLIMLIKVLLEKEIKEINVDQNTTVEDVYLKFKEQFKYPIYLAKVDNYYHGLNHVLRHDSTIEFLDITNSQAAWLSYQNGLILLYMTAVSEILGEDVQVKIGNAINKGLFTTIKSDLDDSKILAIEERMKELVKQDIKIKKEHFDKAGALELAKTKKIKGAKELIESIENIKDISIYTLNKTTEIFYGLMVPRTSYLTLFDLKKYRNGIILRFPHQKDPLHLQEVEDQYQLYKAYAEATKWANLMKINYVKDLNECIKNGKIKDLYFLQEAVHEKMISDIADEIVKEKKRVVLIAGPSSSGKTSFAKRLCTQLTITGNEPLYLGTDDYFVERKNAPLDEFGEKDFECLECVDVKLFNDQLNALLKGEEVDIPEFNFITGCKEFGKRKQKIKNNQIIVIEGIHGLNERLTPSIPKGEKYKIYISPLSQTAIDSHNRIPTTDTRYLRRMVRDYRTRGNSAESTINAWPRVRKGEEKYIFPYANEADVFFNSFCIYEISALKPIAEEILKTVKRSEPEYGEAQRLLELLMFFETADGVEDINKNSIIREFIGGSVLVN